SAGFRTTRVTRIGTFWGLSWSKFTSLDTALRLRGAPRRAGSYSMTRPRPLGSPKRRSFVTYWLSLSGAIPVSL
ncbi:MAG: hypothetical protein ACE5JI_06640, partial [Acidobacteriota bacterium]